MTLEDVVRACSNVGEGRGGLPSVRLRVTEAYVPHFLTIRRALALAFPNSTVKKAPRGSDYHFSLTGKEVSAEPETITDYLNEMLTEGLKQYKVLSVGRCGRFGAVAVICDYRLSKHDLKALRRVKGVRRVTRMPGKLYGGTAALLLLPELDDYLGADTMIGIGLRARIVHALSFDLSRPVAFVEPVRAASADIPAQRTGSGEEEGIE